MIPFGRCLRKYFSTMKYPFPKVELLNSYVSTDPKDKIKRVRLIKPAEIDLVPSVTQQQIKEFKKLYKVTVEANGSKIEYVNSQRSNKISLDNKIKSIISVSGAVATDPSINGILSDIMGSCYEFHLKTLEERKEQPQMILEGVSNAQYILELAHSKCYARQVANQRANIATPEYMEKECQEIAKENNIQIKVIKEDQLRKDRFRLVDAVGRASINKPRVVNLTYRGVPNSPNLIAFIGKGLCFDSGGLNIKVGGSMMGMHLDKHGAVSVMSAIRSIARLKLPVNVTASMGFVENSLNSNAYRPGDIIESRKGLKVEIGNTDAEGRLVLADVMNWTQQVYKPLQMVELSTLTGAIIVGLGHSQAAVFSNCQKLTNSLRDAGVRSRDLVWPMPITEEHRDLVRPKTADLTNSSGKPAGGSCQAAAFLEAFVEPGVSWAHLDIAGASMDSTNLSTGYGPRILIEYARSQIRSFEQ